MASKLDAMSPLKVLSRGYALVQTEDNTLIRTVKQTGVGERIRVNLSDGSLEAMVCDVKEKNNESE